jgi:hypothetical protein
VAKILPTIVLSRCTSSPGYGKEEHRHRGAPIRSRLRSTDPGEEGEVEDLSDEDDDEVEICDDDSGPPAARRLIDLPAEPRPASSSSSVTTTTTGPAVPIGGVAAKFRRQLMKSHDAGFAGDPASSFEGHEVLLMTTSSPKDNSSGSVSVVNTQVSQQGQLTTGPTLGFFDPSCKMAVSIFQKCVLPKRKKKKKKKSKVEPKQPICTGQL